MIVKMSFVAIVGWLVMARIDLLNVLELKMSRIVMEVFSAFRNFNMPVET